MKRITPLNAAAMLVVTALAAAAVAAGAGNGASAAPAAAKKPAVKQAGGFRQVLAAKLGEQLNKPAADVLAAMKAARHSGGKTRADRRAARVKRLEQRLAALKSKPTADRAQKVHAARDAWAAALATPLNVSASDVTAALRALAAQRLESLVRDGWLTSDKRDAELACFDDASKCQGVRMPGLATLRAGL